MSDTATKNAPDYLREARLKAGYQSHSPEEDCRSVVFLAKAAQNCYTFRGIILALRRPWKTQTTRTPPKYGDYTDEKAPQKTSNNPSAKEWE